MSVIQMNEPPIGWVYCNKPLVFTIYEKEGKDVDELQKFIGDIVNGLKKEIGEGVIVWRAHPRFDFENSIYTVKFRLAAMKYE
ncbi:MAG: hypothetical protein KAJ03_12720 [Gammaproteobacteria bacterium]|nr:hypothetical protein [Gammaproteobacteria bacterium]